MDTTTVDTKICKKCGRELPMTSFRIARSNSDGHSSRCKDCLSAKGSLPFWAQMDWICTPEKDTYATRHK